MKSAANSGVSVATTTANNTVSGNVTRASAPHKRVALLEDALNINPPSDSSFVEIRVEDAHFGNALDGQLVTAGGAADSLRRGSVIEAIRHLLVDAHIRTQP